MADPGFPRGGGANSPGGRQHTILPKFPKNWVKSKEFGPPGGCASPAPPLRSATDIDRYIPHNIVLEFVVQVSALRFLSVQITNGIK